MKTNLSLTALALFATSLMLPMQANAADRQISVKPKTQKIQSFTVDNDDQQPIEVATTTPDEPRETVKPKAFRVQEKPVVIEQASNEDNTDAPVITPKKKKAFRFRVEEQTEQAATTATQDEDQDVSSSQDDQPVKLLNEKVKLVKKPRPAPVDNEDEEANNDEPDHRADIAADTSEDVNVETSEEPIAAPARREKHRMYYYASKQKSYEQIHDDYADAEPVTYSYRQSYQPRYYAGSSCHNSNNGY